jgi:hypothetical protein
MERGKPIKRNAHFLGSLVGLLNNKQTNLKDIDEW